MKHQQEPYVYNENPNLLWGDEASFVINALKEYAKTQKDYLDTVMLAGKLPFYTPEYIDQMCKQIIIKILSLQQPKQPEEE